MSNYEKFKNIINTYYETVGFSFLCFGSTRKVLKPSLTEQEKKFITGLQYVAADIVKGNKITINNFNLEDEDAKDNESTHLINKQRQSSNNAEINPLKDIFIPAYNDPEHRNVVFSFFLTAIYQYLIDKQKNISCHKFQAQLTNEFPHLVTERVVDEDAKSYIYFFKTAITMKLSLVTQEEQLAELRAILHEQATDSTTHAQTNSGANMVNDKRLENINRDVASSLSGVGSHGAARVPGSLPKLDLLSSSAVPSVNNQKF